MVITDNEKKYTVELIYKATYYEVFAENKEEAGIIARNMFDEGLIEVVARENLVPSQIIVNIDEGG